MCPGPPVALLPPFVGAEAMVMRRAWSLLAFAALLVLPASALGAPPKPTTGSATQVTSTSAVLNGSFTELAKNDTFFFSYGLTTAYGLSTPVVTYGDHLPKTASVSATVTDLQPATTYHFRLVGREPNLNANYGADVTFTTLAAPATPSTPSDPGSPNPGSPPSTDEPPSQSPSDPPGLVAPVADLGKSVVAGVEQGVVKVRIPGATGYQNLNGAHELPVGTLIDTRSGSIVLQTATAGGSQNATLRGGLFQVRQTVGLHGMTDLILRGGDFSSCRRTGATARSAASTARKPSRTLWAHDNKGKFRSRGRNSVATVRGTTWRTTETCAGTRTTVYEGEVSVYDRHRHKTVIVRAGHSYLARSVR